MKQRALGLFLFVFTTLRCFSQDIEEARIKATYIYGFSKFFTWPAFETFNLGVLSDDYKLIQELNNLASKKMLQGKPIKITVLKETDDFKSFHLIYTDLKGNLSASQIFKKINYSPVLLVTYNNNDFGNSMLNLFDYDGKMRFSLNPETLKNHHLQYSPAIEKLSSGKIITTVKEWNDLYGKLKKIAENPDSKTEITGSELKQIIKDHDDQNKVIITQITELESQKEKINNQLLTLKGQEDKLKLQEERLKVLDKVAELKQSTITEKEKAIEQLNNFILQKEAEISRKERASVQFLDQTKALIDVQEKNLEQQKSELSDQKKKINEQSFVLKTQKSILYTAGAIILIITTLAFVSFRNYRAKQKANALLELKNIEILSQKQIVEEKQKEILDSIYYARRIQRALLPTDKYIEKHLKN